jgi:hypothetical protein
MVDVKKQTMCIKFCFKFNKTPPTAKVGGFIYSRVMDVDYNCTGDVSLDHVCNGMCYRTHHSDMDVPQYVNVDVSSGY